MTAAMLAPMPSARTGPRGFVPPHGAAADARARLSHLDPAPLWAERASGPSPWRSPTFWLACVLVVPVAATLRGGKAIF